MDSRYLSSQTLRAGLVHEELGSLEVLIVLDPTAGHVPHDHVPAQADRVLVGSAGVVGGQAVLEEALGVVVSVALVGSAHHNQRNLETLL